MASNTRKTIVRDSVFRSTGSGIRAATEAAEPKVLTRQTAVWLTDDEIDWLDDTRRQTRKNGGKAITRSALIRALIDVAGQNPVDLKGLTSERELLLRLSAARR